MKNVRTAAALILMGCSTLALANSGEINFKGKLTDATCTTEVEGSGNNEVTLPSMSTNTLTADGATAGKTGFNIKLSGCTLGAGGVTTAAAFFEAGASVDAQSGRLNNMALTDPANAVQLQLLDMGPNSNGGKAIEVGKATQSTGTEKISIIENGETILPYAVQYYATAAATAGVIDTNVTFTINYE